MKKLATWAAVGLLAWWAVTNPASAAHLAHQISAAFNHAAASVSTIVSAF